MNIKSVTILLLGPFLNKSAILGPNGGGKSNVIDALCFVLLVPLKKLRSSNFNVIFFIILTKGFY